MKKVFKFPLKIEEDEQDIMMPAGAKVLTVQVQSGVPCLWAECNPDAECVSRTFLIRGTGHPIDDGIEKEYIGTIQLHGGSLVLHVFEIKNL